MKKLLVAITVIALLAGPVLANKVDLVKPQQNRVACDVNCWFWVWDGTFTTEMCDTQGASIWAYGASNQDPATDCDGNPVENVLGTVLNGDYPNDAGERAILGSFTVTDAGYLLEMCHWYDIENSYDGGNVEVYVGGAWVVIEPMGGYPDDEISDSVSYYAWCVDMQPGFTDDIVAYMKDCFDLSQFIGEEVTLAVKFGTDSSVTYPGWYINSIMLGGVITPTEDGSWSTIKGLY